MPTAISSPFGVPHRGLPLGGRAVHQVDLGHRAEESAVLPRLGARLAGVYRRLGPLYRQVQRRVEADESEMGMSVGVRAVLDELSHVESATVPTLTVGLGLSRQFVQRMVNEAIDAGWVERRDNPVHRRSVLVALTDEGCAAIDAVLAREHGLMGRTPGGLTEDDIDTTLRVLAAMRAALDALEPPEDPDPVGVDEE